MKNHFIALLCFTCSMEGVLRAQAVRQPIAEHSPAKTLTKERWQKISGYLDTSSKSLFISGTIKVDRQAAAEPEVPFLLAKSPGKFYYRLGETETFNSSDAYMYIDHSSKRVLISPSKVIQINIYPDAGMMSQLLEQEPGLIRETVKGRNIRIGFRHETNACKEYAIEFDAVSFTPKSIFERLDDPKQGSELSIQISFTSWSVRQPSASIFDCKPFAMSTTAGWKLKGKVQNYHLTVL